MLRKHKLFSRPKKKFEAQRIKDENLTMEKYGLKTKKEIWKAIAKIKYYRRRAMDLAESDEEEQQAFFTKLNSLGLKVSSIADVLALTMDDILQRRLPSIMANKGLANTAAHARQMVVHKKVRIDGQVVNIPSYIVPVSKEKLITVEQSVKKAEKPVEEVKNE